MDYVARLASPVGELTLASDGETLTGLWIAGQKYHSSGLGWSHERRDCLCSRPQRIAGALFSGMPGARRASAGAARQRFSAGAFGACCWRYPAAKSEATAK